MSERLYEDLRAAPEGDREAAGRLIEDNSGLIWSVARRYFGRGADPDDLYQLGCLGFLKAVEGFDETFGTRFSTYAVPKIAGEIRRFLRDDGIVKVSRSVKEQAAKIRQARLLLEQRIGREPKMSELSAETGLSPEEIAFAETATGPADSIQRGARSPASRHRKAARTGKTGDRTALLPRHDPAGQRPRPARIAGADLPPRTPRGGHAPENDGIKKGPADREGMPGFADDVYGCYPLSGMRSLSPAFIRAKSWVL